MNANRFDSVSLVMPLAFKLQTTIEMFQTFGNCQRHLWYEKFTQVPVTNQQSVWCPECFTCKPAIVSFIISIELTKFRLHFMLNLHDLSFNRFSFFVLDFLLHQQIRSIAELIIKINKKKKKIVTPYST